jgi:hypothetical protein
MYHTFSCILGCSDKIMNEVWIGVMNNTFIITKNTLWKTVKLLGSTP